MIDQELKELEKLLAKFDIEYPPIARDAARARFAYDIAYETAVDEIAHRTIPEGEKLPTVPVQTAMATKMVAKEMETARYAEAELDIMKKLVDNLQARLSSVQTRAKIVTMEMSLK